MDDTPSITVNTTAGYDVHITKNATGETRVFRNSCEWLGPQPGEDWSVSEYYWEDGNGACDCCRGRFFASVGGVMHDDTPCGMTEYSVKIFADDGSILYEEDDPEQAAA